MTRFPGPELEVARNTGFFRLGGGVNTALGRGSPDPIGNANDSLIHGSGCVADSVSNQVLLCGLNQKAYGVYRGLLVGRNNTAGIPGGVYGQFLSEVFCVGKDNDLGTAGTGSYRIATVGRLNTNNGYSDCWIFGRSNTIYSNNSRCTIFGRSNTIYSNSGRCTIFGYGNIVDGDSIHVSGAGNTITLGGESLVVIGDFNIVYGAHGAVFGNSNYHSRGGPGPGSVFFSCGYGNYSNGYQTFAFGRFASVTRNNQRTWSADRAFTLATPGAAQVSDMARWLETNDATQTTIITLDLDLDKTYSIRAYVTGRNTDTPAESATFELPKSALASRDAGVALLQNGPLSLSTTTNTGGGSTAWSVDLAAVGNDILLRITGDALDDVEWITRFEFDEVLG